MINLYCLPFAGGTRYSYRQYEEKAPGLLNFIPLEYPGRGIRSKEPLLKDMQLLVTDLYRQVENDIGREEYAIYGHSMGGLLAYLLTKKIIENGKPAPVHLFITGTSGPSAESRSEKKRHLYSKTDFLAELKSLKGFPDEVLNNDELLDYLEPIIRTDFQVTETYQYEEYAPLDIPFTVITGTEEEMEMEDILLWQKETKYTVDFIRLPGNHFFILRYSGLIVDIISKKLFSKKKPLYYA